MILTSGIKPSAELNVLLQENDYVEIIIQDEALQAVKVCKTFDKITYKSPRFYAIKQRLVLFLLDSEDAKVKTLYTSTKSAFELKGFLLLNEENDLELEGFLDDGGPTVANAQASTEPFAYEFQQSRNIMNIALEFDDEMAAIIKSFPTRKSLMFTVIDEKFQLLKHDFSLQELEKHKEPCFLFINEPRVFIKMVPDTCKAKEKMMYSLSKQNIVERVQILLGTVFEKQIEVSDFADIDLGDKVAPEVSLKPKFTRPPRPGRK